MASPVTVADGDEAGVSPPVGDALALFAQAASSRAVPTARTPIVNLDACRDEGVRGAGVRGARSPGARRVASDRSCMGASTPAAPRRFRPRAIPSGTGAVVDCPRRSTEASLEVGMGVIIIREMVGTSPNSWSDAARQAVATASRTVRNIKTVEVVKSTAAVEDGEIVEYRVEIKIGFEYEG